MIFFYVLFSYLNFAMFFKLNKDMPRPTSEYSNAALSASAIDLDDGERRTLHFDRI